MNSRTSAKLRSAWMPPAVAQAPIVTRKRDILRTSWMRSASCAVVIEPSTRERSYGPLTTARDASGKLAISTAPATASKSSSQSSRLNWQPSNDENFQTASFGLRLAVISCLIVRGSIRRALDVAFDEPVLDRGIAEHRPILADEERSELAVPTVADGAFHVALHRDEDLIVGHALLL